MTLTAPAPAETTSIPTPRRPSSESFDLLTAREAQIVELVAQGLSNKAIGEELSLSPLTIKSHLARIARKTGLHRRSEMASAFGETRVAGPGSRDYVEIFAAFTARELEVVDLVVLGLDNKEIGGRLYLSQDTIKTHMRRIMRKLGAKTRAEVAFIRRSTYPVAYSGTFRPNRLGAYQAALATCLSDLPAFGAPLVWSLLAEMATNQPVEEVAEVYGVDLSIVLTARDMFMGLVGEDKTPSELLWAVMDRARKHNQLPAVMQAARRFLPLVPYARFVVLSSEDHNILLWTAFGYDAHEVAIACRSNASAVELRLTVLERMFRLTRQQLLLATVVNEFLG